MNEDINNLVNNQSPSYGPDISALRINPFAFRCEEKELYHVSTIEDFFIKYRRQYCSFKQVLRGNEIRYHKKKKLILKSIKDWISSFETTEDYAETLNVESTEEFVSIVKKIKFWQYFLLVLSILVFVFVGLSDCGSSMEDAEPIQRFLYGMSSAASDQYGRFGLVLGVYFTIASILMIGVFNTSIKCYFKLFNSKARLADDMKDTITRDFKQKSKGTLKYYKKVLRKRNISAFPPLPIEETGISGVSFIDLKIVKEEFRKSESSLKKKKLFLNFIKYVSLFGTYALAAFVLLYAVIKAIIYLI